MADPGFTWVASYPKSGNTMLRLLLEAHHYNSDSVDINNMVLCTGDTGEALMQGVSPVGYVNLGLRAELLLRPAALLNLFCRTSLGLMTKTHWCNIQPPGLPPCIPPEFTKHAVYVVRDPRAVFLSYANYYSYAPQKAAEMMNNDEFTIGGQKGHARTLVSSWTKHVASWTGEKNFPVHVVKYEDMVKNPAKELTEVLEFLGKDTNEDRIARAVEASRISKIQAAEKDDGFREHNSSSESFFGNGGGTRWQDEAGQKWIKQIEEDHGDMMRILGYLDEEVIDLKAVT